MTIKVKKATWYPGFDVMAEQHEWDQHTRQVVLGRLQYHREFRSLTADEVELLFAIAEQLVWDDREPILRFMVHQLDQKLSSDIGQNQKPEQVPSPAELLHAALQQLERAATGKMYRGFLRLQPQERCELLQRMERGVIDWVSGWDQQAQKHAFQVLATTLVKAYYSHPTVWSEIGYAGPAYPRGYVRTEYGLTDPWEARRQ